MSVFSKADSSASSRSRAFSWGTKAVALTAVGLLLASCSSGTSASSSGAAVGDLTLSVGTLLPQTGSLATLGPPMFAGVKLAVADINAAKAGITVKEIDKDSGDTTTDIATQSVTSLIASKVGAIVGAASSSVTLSVLDQVTAASTTMISPANTAAKLSGASKFYFRTAPTDLIQGAISGKKLIDDGKKSVALLYSNDDYATGLAGTITKTLEAAGITPVADVKYDPTASNYSAEVSQVLAKNPDALMQIGFDESKTIYAALATAGFDFSKLYGTDGNFGLMAPGSSPDIAGAQYTNPGVNASSDFQAKLKAIDPTLTTFAYAAESYDATVLAALAALQGKGVDGATVQANMISVSDGGTKCTIFADCAKLIAAGTDIDYDGLSGPIAFNTDGDVTTGSISIYQYEKGNTNKWISTSEASL